MISSGEAGRRNGGDQNDDVHDNYLHKLKRRNIKEAVTGCYMCGAKKNVQCQTAVSERTTGSTRLCKKNPNCEQLYSEYQYKQYIVGGLPEIVKQRFPLLQSLERSTPLARKFCHQCGARNTLQLECVPSVLIDFDGEQNAKFGINVDCDRNFIHFFCRNKICLPAYSKYINSDPIVVPFIINAVQK
jgi:hypothetical protein